MKSTFSAEPLVILMQKEPVPHYRVSVYNHLSDRLREQGIALRVLAEKVEAGNPHRLRFDLVCMSLSPLKIIRHVALAKPQALIVFMSLKEPVVWPILLYGRIVGYPVINWRHSVDLSQPRNLVKNALYAGMNLLARRVVLYSEDEKKRVPATQRWKMKVANNTLNFRDMPAVFATKEDLKKTWGIPFRKVVLFSGRIQARKRIGHLLRAFEQPGFAEYGLVVVGPGELVGLKAWAQLHRNAVILGPQYDPQRVAEIFKMADVFCIPGAVGLSINEAFFWGLPIVTEVAHHGPEICYLREGENGFMVKDANQLACRLLELLRDDGLRRRMSMNARETILREGSIETMIDGFLDAIREVSRRGGRDGTSPEGLT